MQTLVLWQPIPYSPIFFFFFFLSDVLKHKNVSCTAEILGHEMCTVLTFYLTLYWKHSHLKKSALGRSSHQRCSIINGVPATLLKKRLWHRCFAVNFAKFLRTTLLQNTSVRLLLIGVIIDIAISISIVTQI